MTVSTRIADLAANFRPPPKVRFNAEDFGFIVGFPDGEIVLTSPAAAAVLKPETEKAELAPFLLETIDAARGFHLRTPVLAWLELTRKCNLTCQHCYIDAGRPRRDELPAERWFSLLDEMADMGVWAVAFTGGEPTLHPSFAEIVRHARRRKLLVGVATHGMFLTDALLESLPREGVIISVSIDDLHTGHRGHDSPPHLGREALLRAMRHGFLTNIMTNTHRANIGGLPELIAWAKANEVSVRSVPFSPIGARAKRNRHLENRVEDVERAAEFWLEECSWEHVYHSHAGLCVGSIFNYGLSLAYMTRRCSSGRYLCYVASDGTVFPCTMCAGENIFSARSVATDSFSAIWRSNWPMRQYCWDDFSAACEGCPINSEAYYCAARCPAMSHARHGVLNRCGASEFEVASTIHRTQLLNQSPLAANTAIPVRAFEEGRKR